MTTSTMRTTRRFSPALRLKLQVVFAKAWDALAETYRVQAAEFVRRVGPWLPIDEALDRYFREVGVPAAMTETVRARALITLAPLIEQAMAAGEATEESSAPWLTLRLDHLVGTLRQRAQQIEDTNLQCRMAACVADEAVAATHVHMAIETVETLMGELTPDEAIMHYVRTFNLPALEAQTVFQRAMAQWAGHGNANTPALVASFGTAAVCASAPTLQLAAAAPSFRVRLHAQV
jgi:hypothetical protein